MLAFQNMFLNGIVRAGHPDSWESAVFQGDSVSSVYLDYAATKRRLC